MVGVQRKGAYGGVSPLQPVLGLGDERAAQGTCVVSPRAISAEHSPVILSNLQKEVSVLLSSFQVLLSSMKLHESHFIYSLYLFSLHAQTGKKNVQQSPRTFSEADSESR